MRVMRAIRRALEAKSLAGKEFQPAALEHEQLPPVEKRLRLPACGATRVQFFLAEDPHALGETNKQSPLWLSVPVISPVPSSTTFSIHIFSNSGSSGQRLNIAAIGFGKGFGKNR